MYNQYTPNTASIPNILFDYWMEKLSPAEFKVLMCIARKTYGWRKNHDYISLSQIEKMTGLSRKGVVKNINSLTKYNLIIKIKSKSSHGDDDTNRYEINVNFQDPNVENSVHQGRELSSLGVGNSVHQGVGNSVHPQNPTYTKSNIQKDLICTCKEEVEGEEIDNVSSPKGDAKNKIFKTSKTPKKEFSIKVLEVTQKMISILRKHNPHYRPPKDMNKFHEDVEELIEKDEQDVKKMLELFEWAASDTLVRGTYPGWQSFICKNNFQRKKTSPAGILRDNIATIYGFMRARKERKFCPSSSQEAMDKASEMFNEGVL